MQALSSAIATFEGAVIAVSHDESFVNSLLGGSKTTDKVNKGTPLVDNTAIYTLSDQQIRRFEGTFREYKKKVMKSVVFS